MTEIELKFQVPQERRAALAKAVATATARNVRLQAHYFDTADRHLAQALLALRVRKEGRRWVQTLKGAGDGLWQRVEHEVPVTVAPGQLPVADPVLHDGTAASAHSACARRSMSLSHSRARPARCSASSAGFLALRSPIKLVTSDV